MLLSAGASPQADGVCFGMPEQVLMLLKVGASLQAGGVRAQGYGHCGSALQVECEAGHRLMCCCGARASCMPACSPRTRRCRGQAKG